MNGAKRFLSGCVVVGCTVASSFAAEISLVPVDASGPHTLNGNEIILQGAGQTVFLEIYIRDWDPDHNGTPLLRAFQANIESNGYSSGSAGTLGPRELACGGEPDPDAFCKAAFGASCKFTGNACTVDSDCPFFPAETCIGPTCDYPTLIGGLCQPGFILTGRLDYIFKTVTDLPAVDLSAPSFRYASAAQDTGITDPGTAGYAGTLVLDVPVGAAGTFTIGFQPSPDSVLQDDQSVLIPNVLLTPAMISIACQSSSDCDDSDACTDDICTGGGTCSNSINYDDSTFCCNPADGGLTALDDGNECTTGMCDASTGVVTQDPLPADTACGDPTSTECNGPDTCDGAGVCQTNDLPAGSACGDPTSTECDGPDQCDNAGLCQPNFAISGTTCGDSSMTDCTDPDTCDGGGACQPNDFPNGTDCDDGLFCNVNEACSGGVCTGGGPRDCDDGLTCTSDSCNEGSAQCDNLLNLDTCLIAGVCYAEDASNPANDCEACLSAMATDDWSFRPNGSACDDGEACTGTGRPGIGVDTCDGAGLCSGVPDPQCNDNCPFAIEVVEGVTLGNNDNRGPDDTEASCQPDSNNDVWFVYTASCDGDVYASTTGSMFTPSNDPVLSVYDECPDANGNEIACDDDSGVNLQAALTFNATTGSAYYIRVAGFEDNSGDIVLNIATVDGCFIDDVCYLAGALNPGNDCEACIPTIATDAWSPRSEGSACGDASDTECDSPDACDGAGSCEVNFKPEGTLCSDDTNECTFDFCSEGLCTHPPRPMGTVCGDPNDTECDNPDSCDAVGTCQPNYEPQGLACGDPTVTQCDLADICDGNGLCDVHYVPQDTPCDDNDICTGDDVCSSGLCAGMPIPEAPTVEAGGSRYLLVTPNPAGTPAPVALALTSSDWTCLQLYVQPDGSLGNTPVFQVPDDWGTVSVTGDVIVPVSSYTIEADCGSFVSPPGNATTGLWGDIVGIFSDGAWTPPNGIVDINDTIALRDAFRGLSSAPPIEAVDLAPCEPDGIVDVLDLVYLVDAFRGFPYPCADPCP